jgi:hypothetical protein
MRPCIPPPPPARDTAPCAPPESGEWVISPARRAQLTAEWQEAEGALLLDAESHPTPGSLYR